MGVGVWGDTMIFETIVGAGLAPALIIENNINSKLAHYEKLL